MIQQISDYLKKHETLILGVGILTLVLVLGNKWLGHRVQIADAANIQAQAALQQQKEKVAELTAAAQEAKKNSDAVVAQTASEVAALQGEISILKISLAQQQAAIRVKPLPELTTQWNALISLPDGVQNTDKGLVASEPAARATVSKLVEVESLNAQVSDYEGILSQKDLAIDAQKQTIDSNVKLVAGLNTQITDEKTACTKQISLAKAVSRKSKKTWFLIGYGLGLGTRGIVKLTTGF